MKNTLAILGLLALISQPAFAQTSLSPNNSSANTGIGSTSSIGAPESQGQDTEEINQPETNSESSGRNTRNIQIPETGGSAGLSPDDATGNPGTVRGYW